MRPRCPNVRCGPGLSCDTIGVTPTIRNGVGGGGGGGRGRGGGGGGGGAGVLQVASGWTVENVPS